MLQQGLRATRRHFFGQSAGAGLFGLAALAGLGSAGKAIGAGLPSPHGSALNFPRKPAKHLIFLFQSGGPSHLDLFDYKPRLNELNGQQLPEHVRRGQRLTGMSANQASIPLAGSVFKFQQYGPSGVWISELMPHTAAIADRICFVRSMYTEAINHDPAITFFQTGSQLAGRPSLGAWLSYGLGSESENLPAFVVLVTAGQGDQPLYDRLWGSGFLDSRHQGVRLRAGREPVLYLANPDGVDAHSRREMLDRLASLNRLQAGHELDPEIESRIAQYELAWRMQTSVPEITDFSGEDQATLELYGSDVQVPGSFAANCLLARRLVERGVRIVQLYHQGWDQHGNLPADIHDQAIKTDQPSAALVLDLERRGLLDETLVVWGGEFGRTAYSQGQLSVDNYGRDHHPRCFTMWMAGGGSRAGYVHGQTDEYGYNLADPDGNPIFPTKDRFHPHAVHVHDLQATILHLMGVDHTRLTFRHQGRDFRLTDVHGHLVDALVG